mgnify:CR=1 FL=1
MTAPLTLALSKGRIFEETVPLLAAAELQDHLMTVTNDLERLQRLLDDAGEALSTHFYSASNQVMSLQSQAGDTGAVHEGLRQIMQEIAGAITALGWA